MLHFRNWTVFAGLAVLAVACTPSTSDPAATTPPEPSEPPAPAVPMAPDPAVAEPEFNVGDVEQGLDIEAALAPESNGANVEVERLESRDGRLKILTITLSPPYPEELWLEYTVNARVALDKRPVVLRGAFLRDKRQELGAFGLLLDKRSARNDFVAKINAFEGLDVHPENIGVTVDAEALLMPEGTDPATVDVATATAEGGDRTKALYHTTVVVYYQGEPAAEAADGAQ